MMREELSAIVRRWTPGTVIVRVAAMALLWLVLAEGEFHLREGAEALPYQALILIAVLGGAFASLALVPSSGLGWSPIGWARFIPFFLAQSVLGGVDVALRAVAPKPRLDPGYVEFRFRITEEPARVFVANTISLMPGTLSVDLDGDRLRMHVLDRSMPAVERAREIEEYAASMFRLELPGE
jgi:multicomponent Na+:H+ antiporter subunit E